MATVVIIGGGTGGLSTAIALRKGLEKEHKVVVVEREGKQYFLPSLLWVMDGRRTAESISRDIAPVTSQGIILERNEATDIDFDRCIVLTKSEEIPYDFLVLSPGVEYALDAIPGLEASLGSGDLGVHPAVGFNLYTIEGVLGLRGALQVFPEGDVTIVAPPGPYRCPPVVYEAAMLLDSYFRQTRRREKIRINIFTPEPTPFSLGGEKIADAILMNLRRSGITYKGGVTTLQRWTRGNDS